MVKPYTVRINNTVLFGVGNYSERKGVIVLGVTAKDLMKAQKKRYMSQKQKEEAAKVTEEMKQKFQRKPYYMTVEKGERR